MRPDHTRVYVVCIGGWGNFGHIDDNVETFDKFHEAVADVLEYARDRAEQGLDELKQGIDPETALSRVWEVNEVEIISTTLGAIRATGEKCA